MGIKTRAGQESGINWFYLLKTCDRWKLPQYKTRLNSKYGMGRWGGGTYSQGAGWGSVGGKLLRGNMGREFCLNQLDTVLAEGRPVWSDTRGGGQGIWSDIEGGDPHRTDLRVLLHWVLPRQTWKSKGWGHVWEEGSEEPDYSLVKAFVMGYVINWGLLILSLFCVWSRD